MVPTKQIYDGSYWLLFISLLIMTILLSGTVLSSKIVAISPTLIQPGSTVVYPLAFLLSGVIAEIYGYNTSKKLIFFIIICGYIFAFSIQMVLLMPSPADWTKAASYQDIFGNILRFSTAGTLGIIVGLLSNSYIISKTKILIQGKYFCLRSLGAIAIGEAAHIIVTATLLYYNTPLMNQLTNIFLSMYLFRMGCAFVFIIPTKALVSLIRKTENITFNDFEIKFNKVAP